MADHLASSPFPIQKGSLNLLRQKWESSDHPRSKCCPGDSHCRLLQPLDSKLLEPEGEVLAAPEVPDPLSLPCGTGQILSAEPEDKSPEDKSDHSRECSLSEVLKEDSLAGRRRIERISISLDELRSVFEAPKFGHRTPGPAEYDRKLYDEEMDEAWRFCKDILIEHLKDKYLRDSTQ